MRFKVLFFLLLFILNEKTHAKSLELPIIAIDENFKDEFPAKPTRGTIYKIRNETESDRFNTSELSHSEGVEIITIENLLANQKQIEIEPKNLKGTIKKGKNTFRIEGNKIFKNSKLLITLDCTEQNVTKKVGFQETLDNIEKQIKSKEVQDALIVYLSSFVEQAPDQCKKVLGPFNEINFIGKKPGSAWEENVPIKGFENAKLNAKFSGWLKSDNKLFAVLEGKSKVNLESTASLNTKSSIEITSYIIVSSDWKIIKRLVLTKLDVSSTNEGHFSGSFKIDQVSTQLN